MEEIEGMFSSPEKSPTGLNGFAHDDESDNDSDGMSIDDGKSSNTSVFLLNNPQRVGLALFYALMADTLCRQCSWSRRLSRRCKWT